LPPLSRDPKIRKATRLLEAEMARRKKAAVPGPVGRPWGELGKAEKLEQATDRSLDRVFNFLLLDVDPVSDPKLFALQQSVALSTISNQIRLDAAALQAQVALANVPDGALSLRLEQAFARLDEIVLDEEDDNGDAAAGTGLPAAAEGG
jgi:hypothetical protein